MGIFFAFALPIALVIWFVAFCVGWRSASAIVTSVSAGLFFGWIGYLSMPTIQYGFSGFPAIILFVGCVAAIILLASLNNGYYEKSSLSVFGAATVSILWALPLLYWFIVAPITTWGAWHHKEYRALIQVEERVFSDEEISPTDITQVRTVDQSLARILAEKRLGEYAGLGSKTLVSDLNIQVVNGTFTLTTGQENAPVKEEVTFRNELFWVGPLGHAGFFKWMANDTTPGYVMVSATDQSRIYLVRAVNGEWLALRYLMSGTYLWDWIVRHTYRNGYASTGLTDFTFEINDEGRPYWVITLFRKKVGFSGNDPYGVITVDAQTGAISEYGISDAPRWIDRIQPEDIILGQLRNWGTFVSGWLNSWLAEEGVVVPTPGMSLVYGTDGSAYWYTGMQSTKSDNSTTGFMLVNTRTKETRWYRIAGATEEAARWAAMNHKEVRAQEYYGSAPILYNVAGVPTYFLILKGNDGRAVMFAFVNVRDYNIIGVGERPAPALRNYHSALRGSVQVAAMGDVERALVSALVYSITTEIENGGTVYYMRFKEYPNKEFFAAPVVGPELKWTHVGQIVKIMFDDDGGTIRIPLIQFENPNVPSAYEAAYEAR